MESIKNFLKSLLSEDGNISSKRFIAIAGFLFLAYLALKQKAVLKTQGIDFDAQVSGGH